MKLKYLFEKKANYLYMIISGDYDENELMDIIQIIFDECIKEKTHKILVNVLEVDWENFGIIQRFYLGDEIAKVLSNKIKFAAVLTIENLNHFTETVASNRGAHMKVFHDLITAESWIESD